MKRAFAALGAVAFLGLDVSAPAAETRTRHDLTVSLDPASHRLTAYLADHLVQEQRGKGDESRRATLETYVDCVKAGRDFPLTEFRSRESAATEAVGYGKALMGFHMVRRELGDDAFRKILAAFYRENIYLS